MIPEEVISEKRKGKKKGEPYGFGVAKILVTVVLIPLATITAISLIQTATRTRNWAEFVYRLSLFLASGNFSVFWRDLTSIA